MNHGGGEAVARQFLGETLGAALGAGEDQGLTFFAVEKLAEDVDFFAGTNFVSFQFYTLGRLQNRAQRYADWIAHVFMHQSGDGGFEGGGEAQRLASLG